MYILQQSQRCNLVNVDDIRYTTSMKDNRTSKAAIARMDRANMIRKMITEGRMNQSAVARMLGISKQAVNQILNRHKTNARRSIAYAVKTGKVIRPDSCSDCGCECIPEAHHND